MNTQSHPFLISAERSRLRSLSPRLAELWQDVAGRLGAGPDAAREASRVAALNVEGIPVAAFDVDEVTGGADGDLAVIAELEGARVRTLDDAKMLLHANMVFGIASGFCFGTNTGGEVHALFTVAPADADAGALAERIAEMASCAAVFKQQLARDGGSPADAPAHRGQEVSPC
jgi:hypothetical protein